MTATIPSGIWRHAKGPDYLVIGLASDSNNIDPYLEPQVVYVSLESSGRKASDLPMHIRRLSEFLERFTPVDSGSTGEGDT